MKHENASALVRYLVDNGVKWPALPADYPGGGPSTISSAAGGATIRELYERLRRSARTRRGRNAERSAGIIGSQSVDASETVGEDSRGYDGGKMRDGRKRHVLTDSEGLLLEVTVTPADVHDSKAARGGSFSQAASVHQFSTGLSVGSRSGPNEPGTAGQNPGLRTALFQRP
ncbi:MULTISPECIES: transposase [unclassified Streptomyces]|uniref:transposase n=1 Tax=unclassified Streptomyces TaxID=2593676 RepID=UPI0036F00A4D